MQKNDGETINLLRQEAQRQLNLLTELLRDAKRFGLVDAPVDEKDNQGTFDTDSLHKALQILDGEICKLNNFDMVVAVVGTMKAGKSTTINAIVGVEILPSRNRAMTSLPTMIRHTLGNLSPKLVLQQAEVLNKLLDELRQPLHNADKETQKSLANDSDMSALLSKIENKKSFVSCYEGEKDIFSLLKELNDLVRLSMVLDVNFPFDRFSTVDSIPIIEVEFSHLKSLTSTQGRFALLDTPGPNEAGQQHLRDMLQDQLQKSSAVLAVMDYVQLNSDADEQVRKILLEISAINKNSLYVMVNKFDQKNRNGDDEASVKKLVSEKLLGNTLAAEYIFPVSANNAYLASRALNEIRCSGKLDEKALWVEDFGKIAFGEIWEDDSKDIQRVQARADALWGKSGFAIPVEQVIVKSFENSALGALASAASKISHVAKNAEVFFRAHLGSMTKSAAILEKNIDNLHKSIRDIDQAEVNSCKKLNFAFTRMEESMANDARKVQEKIVALLQNYLKEGRGPESGLSGKQSSASARANKRGRSFVRQENSSKSNKTFEADENQSNRGSIYDGLEKKENLITFKNKSDLENFLGEMQDSVRGIFDDAELNVQNCIDRVISDFWNEFESERLNSLTAIKESVQNNLDDFDIKISWPNPGSISFNNSVSDILVESAHEKTIGRRSIRKKSGFLGTVLGLIKDEWGMEYYNINVKCYEVDVSLVEKALLSRLREFSLSANDFVNKNIVPKFQAELECFFGEFREKISHIRGDLINGIQRCSLDDARKKSAVKYTGKMVFDASNLNIDCVELSNRIEAIR